MGLVTVDWAPSERHLRQFGAACVVAVGALGGWVLWRASVLGVALAPESAPRVAGALWGLAVACGVLGWVAPGWLRPLYVGLMAASFPIGFVIAHVVMGIVFFGVVTPIALVFRVTGRDALERKLDRGAATYWRRRSAVVDVARYYRQF